MINSNREAYFLRRSKEQSECTKEFITHIDALRRKGQQDVETIWDSASHVNLISHDLMALLYFMTRTDEIWTLRTLTRAIATLIHEGTDDLQHLLGKCFIDACKTASVFDRIESDYRITKKKLSAFQQEHTDKLKPIRMTSGAHKDLDFVKFLRCVVNASPDDFIHIAREFEVLLTDIGKLCQTVMDLVKESYRKNG